MSKYETRLKRGEKVVLYDDFLPYLERYLKNGDANEATVTSIIAYKYKEGAREKNAQLFPIRSGKYQKSIKYTGSRKSKRKTLKGGPLSSIFEYNGANILPKEKEALSTINNPRTNTFITRGPIYVGPRPWFFNAVREMRNKGLGKKEINEYLVNQLLGR